MSDQTMGRTVGYARVSTKEQASAGNSLPAQDSQIRAYTDYKQGDLLQIFVNKDNGESAVKVDFLERPEVAEMILYSKQNDVTDIVITKLDRGFRNAVDLLLTIDILKAQGFRLHLLDIALDPTTPVGELVATIMAAIARFECKRRRERQMDALVIMRQTGKCCGTVPYGWAAVWSDYADKDGRTRREVERIYPDDEEQRVLRQIVHWIETETMAVSKIARLLNEAGTPTKQGGKKWFPGTVASVYKHRRIAEVGSRNAEQKAA
jgi:DNA invertase Pin-like site-specific DNA recombinase